MPNLQSHCPVTGSSNYPSGHWNCHCAGTARSGGLLSSILFLASFRSGLCASQHLYRGLVRVFHDPLLGILVGRLHGVALQRTRDGMSGHGSPGHWLFHGRLSLGAPVAPVPTKSRPLRSSPVSKAKTTPTRTNAPPYAATWSLVVCPTKQLLTQTARGHAGHYG